MLQQLLRDSEARNAELLGKIATLVDEVQSLHHKQQSLHHSFRVARTEAPGFSGIGKPGRQRTGLALMTMKHF